MTMLARACRTHLALRRTLLAVLLLAMTACSLGPYDRNELADIQPPGSLFLAELSARYAELGDAEKAEYDWPDTTRFYRRALQAARGKLVEPEALDDRDLAPAARDELAAGRARLVALFSSGARSIAGADSARAQAGFDCLMQESEEGHQPEDIQHCREAFLAALEGIEGAVKGALVVLLPDSDGKVGVIAISNAQGSVTLTNDRASALTTGTDAAPTDAGTFAESDVDAVFGEAIAAAPTPPVTFLLYFEQGTDILTPDSEQRLAEVLETIQQRKLPQVEVSGHTDRAGSTSYNDRLALDRARIVEAAVLALGVSGNLVTVASYGERDPVVPTADGVSEARNRRVEIVIR